MFLVIQFESLPPLLNKHRRVHRCRHLSNNDVTYRNPSCFYLSLRA